jgi:hypothetical protein
MEVLSRKGRTSTVYRVREGLVCKVPQVLRERFRAEVENAFAVEKQLLERLGSHPGIVKYVLAAIYTLLDGHNTNVRHSGTMEFNQTKD